MGPVRIKYYGLFWMTRRTYLVIQTITLVLGLALMATGLWAMISMGTVFPRMPAKMDDVEVVLQALIMLFWVVLLALLAESIETYLVLRKFARAEAEQRAKLPASEERPNTNIQP